MHVYVLHPDSIHVTSVQDDKEERIRVVFPKAFHISPFMEVDQVYDWIFDKIIANDIHVHAKMLKNSETYFTASFQVTRQAFTPWSIALTLLKFPVYCVIAQIWIHYQAFWLFGQGSGLYTTSTRSRNKSESCHWECHDAIVCCQGLGQCQIQREKELVANGWYCVQVWCLPRCTGYFWEEYKKSKSV